MSRGLARQPMHIIEGQPRALVLVEYIQKMPVKTTLPQDECN